jgi:cyclohexyl-isocyanide hydratase
MGAGVPDLNIGFVIFPELTQLDFTGPLQVLSRLPGAATHVVAKTEAPVPSDSVLTIVPTHTFTTCPPLDLICVPGGTIGVVAAMTDRETIEFIREQAASAMYVTSVCTGAFLLGVAGLLQGRRATTHWAFTGLLPLVGATHERARVVRDGNVITAGGVTSGIDFGLSVVAELAGEAVAPAGHRVRSGPAVRCGPSRPRTPRGAIGGLPALRSGSGGIPRRPDARSEGVGHSAPAVPGRQAG